MFSGRLGGSHTLPGQQAQPVRLPVQRARLPRGAPAAPRAVMAQEAPARPASGTAQSTQPHGRLFNFSAGPAVLPVEVLEAAHEDLLNWRGSGMSVMEMSHRGKEFSQIIEEAEADLRTLLAIPANYRVLFLQARITSSSCNLVLPKRTADRPVGCCVLCSVQKVQDTVAKVRLTECRRVLVAKGGAFRSVQVSSMVCCLKRARSLFWEDARSQLTLLQLCKYWCFNYAQGGCAYGRARQLYCCVP